MTLDTPWTFGSCQSRRVPKTPIASAGSCGGKRLLRDYIAGAHVVVDRPRHPMDLLVESRASLNGASQAGGSGGACKTPFGSRPP